MYDELQKLLGQPLHVTAWGHEGTLPLYLSSGRTFDVIHIGNGSFLSVTPNAEENFSVTQLDKQREKIAAMATMPVAFNFSQATTHQRDSLIRHGIPFLLLPKQIYLPFMGTVLQNYSSAKKPALPVQMQPATQQVFLWLFYHRSEAPIGKAKLAGLLGLSKISLTRAAMQLESLGILSPAKNARSPLTLSANADLRGTVQSVLINPVQRTIFVPHSAIPVELPMAGEQALSEYSMLNPPKLPVYACFKHEPWLSEVKPIDPLWDDTTDCVQLELWKYRPTLFSQRGMVDVLSLYCSLKGTEDERIEGELELLMEEVEW